MQISRSHLRTLHNWVSILGVNPLTTIRTLRGLPFYFRDWRNLSRQARTSSHPFRMGPAFICLGERFSQGGTARGQYFHQDLLVASRVHANAPSRHVDVGSRVDGFVAHVASFRQIDVLDIRPTVGTVHNISFLTGDLTAALAPSLIECTDSLSCLHALEHFGLGRYGDTIDYDGYLKGLANLTGMLKPNGTLYLSVPIGEQRIEFNAHRVFSVRFLLELVRPAFHVERFSYVDDRGDLHDNVALNSALVDSNFGCSYGCGILELSKKQASELEAGVDQV